MSRRVELIFWSLAATAFGIYGLSIGETWVYQHYLNSQFAEMLEAPTHARIQGVSAVGAVRKTKPLEGQPIARLEIPAIKLSAVVTEGIDASTLRRSVGHIPGTSRPGGPGNVGLSGHRDTFFRHLGELHSGDRISIAALDGHFEYVVESTSIVDPDETIVLRPIQRPTLTLITCYPFYYVGHAPKRFVVHAALIEN